MKKGKILVVDDNAGIRAALKFLLPMHFEQVEFLSSPVSLVSTVEKFHPDVVLLDMNFHTDMNTGNEGLYWVGELQGRFPQVRVVLFTAYADVQLAVEGMKRGAFDFIVKPWENDHLISVLKAACGDTKKKISPQTSTHEEVYWGSSEAMAQIRRTVEKISATDATVLLTGENGTGKDVLACQIHRSSHRAACPMISIDAGAIPDSLFESELFGHTKGAFTDAVSDHKGLFEMANGGTVFLDEIGNVSLANQAKLLRVLQNRTITRVGSTEAIPIDIRLICATNANLEALVSTGAFRQDLYFRINTIQLHLPSLRSRVADIVPLAKIFLARYAQKYHRAVADIDPRACEALTAYPFSGNIRQLQNCIEKAVILCEGVVLTVQDLDLPVARDSSPSVSSGFRMTDSPNCHSGVNSNDLPRHSGVNSNGSFRHSGVNSNDLSRHSEGTPSSSRGREESLETLDEAEERAIRKALECYNGNLTLVAKSLGVTRPTLYSKLKKYGI